MDKCLHRGAAVFSRSGGRSSLLPSLRVVQRRCCRVARTSITRATAAETVEDAEVARADSVPDLKGGKFTDSRRCVFVEQHRIRSYEVGPDRRATVPNIANLMQV